MPSLFGKRNGIFSISRKRLYIHVFFVSIICWFFFFHKRNYNLTHEGIVHNADPEQVWEFVADFSNMMKLNPTIEEFNILKESGNYEHWKYWVEYTEHLSATTWIKNHAVGQYSIKRSGHGFVIESKHTTCFIFGMNCFYTEAEFFFERSGDHDTRCIETIHYQCPLGFIGMCEGEVKAQRKLIMGNLRQHFSTLHTNKHNKKV
ncbi:hypothetical protein TKK_0006820 [Trichogramma kaykai]|uniref:Uncharacterized protein n=1 Tax=Trichogramma kaykai TaxID=54128 RepID=A0ABD2XDC0_9HYME